MAVLPFLGRFSLTSPSGQKEWAVNITNRGGRLECSHGTQQIASLPPGRPIVGQDAASYPISKSGHVNTERKCPATFRKGRRLLQAPAPSSRCPPNQPLTTPRLGVIGFFLNRRQTEVWRRRKVVVDNSTPDFKPTRTSGARGLLYLSGESGDLGRQMGAVQQQDPSGVSAATTP